MADKRWTPCAHCKGNPWIAHDGCRYLKDLEDLNVACLMDNKGLECVKAILKISPSLQRHDAKTIWGVNNNGVF